MSVQEVSNDIKERFSSGADSVSDWMSNMDPTLKGQLLTALIGAGGGGLLGGLLTGDHVGESSSDRRMRLLKNALLGALLGGGAGFGLRRGTEQLNDAMTPTKSDLKEDAESAESTDLVSRGVGSTVGGLGGIYAGNKILSGLKIPGGPDPDWDIDKKNKQGIKQRTGNLGGVQDPKNLNRQQLQRIFDQLRNEGASPTDARDKIYSIRSKTGMPGAVPRRRSGDTFSWLEQFRRARQAGQGGDVKGFLNTLFGTQNTTGGVKKTLRGSMNTLKGINNRILPSAGAMSRTGHRLRIPALLAAIGGGAYYGGNVGGMLGNTFNEYTSGSEIEDAIRDYEEAPE